MVFLHLATIFEEKSAWDTVKYEVLTFAETQKPSILRMKMNFFQRVCRPNEGKSLISIKKALLSFEKRVFEESKLEFWAPYFHLKLRKRGLLMLSLEFWGGPKEPKRAQNDRN